MNIPLLLTYLRIGLIPAIVVVFYIPGKLGHVLAASLFALAAITDWFDGYLARNLNQATKLGAFLDPVADKLVVHQVHEHDDRCQQMKFSSTNQFVGAEY